MHYCTPRKYTLCRNTTHYTAPHKHRHTLCRHINTQYILCRHVHYSASYKYKTHPGQACSVPNQYSIQPVQTPSAFHKYSMCRHAKFHTNIQHTLRRHTVHSIYTLCLCADLRCAPQISSAACADTQCTPVHPTNT